MLEEADPFARGDPVLLGAALQMPCSVGLFDQGRPAKPRDHFPAARLFFVMSIQFHGADLKRIGWTNAVQLETLFGGARICSP
jgi:hypothetical protein